MMDFVGRAKWDAWNTLGTMSQEDAQKAYIELIDSLLKDQVHLSTIIVYDFLLLSGSIFFFIFFFFYI